MMSNYWLKAPTLTRPASLYPPLTLTPHPLLGTISGPEVQNISHRTRDRCECREGFS